MLEGSNRKLMWVGLGVAILAALILFGSRAAASYYYEKGREFYFKDNVGGNHFKEAKANFSRSLTFNSKNPASHMYLGRIALGMAAPSEKEYYPEADWATALLHYKKALDLGIKKTNNNFYAHTLENLGHAYLRAGQHAEAKTIYLQKIEHFPNFFFGDQNHRSTFWPRFLTAEMDFERFNNPTEAYNLLQPIANPANADPANIYRVYTLLARLSYYFEWLENTEKYARLAIENAPKDDKSVDVQIAHLILAGVYGERGDIKLSEKEIATANALTNSPNTHSCALSFAYFRAKSYQQAIEIAKTKKATVSYQYSICLRSLAESYEATNKTAEAKKYFEDYLKLTDKLPEKNIFVIRTREKFTKKLQGP